MSIAVTEESTKPDEQPQAIDSDKAADVVETQQSEGSPIAEQPNDTSLQETVDASITTPAEDTTVEGTLQESRAASPTTEEKPKIVQDESTTVQEPPTKEEAFSDMQEESNESVDENTQGSAATEYNITELPTLQEEVTPQELQEVAEIISSKQ